MKDIEAIVDELIEREGGYANHPADRGGPTKYGITQRVLAEYRGRKVTEEHVRDLSRVEAMSIYRDKYLTSPQLHRIKDPYLMVLAFDCAVLHGPQRAVRWMQKIAGVVDDGILGPISEVAINTMDPVRMYQKLLARRFEFFGEIISRDPELKRARAAGYNLQAEFALGWLRRAAGFLEV